MGVLDSAQHAQFGALLDIAGGENGRDRRPRLERRVWIHEQAVEVGAPNVTPVRSAMCASLSRI